MLCMTPLLSRNVSADEGSLQAAVTVLASLAAETSISEAMDTDGVVVIRVNIDRIKDPATGETAIIPGGIASFTASVTTGPAGGVEVLGVRGVSPFDSPGYDPVTGILSAVSSSPQQPKNTTVAMLVVRLTGDALTSCNLTVSFQEIIASDPPNMNVPGEAPDSLTFQRGDANGDGAVNIFDAMYIAQYVVGNRTLDQLRPVNSASVNFGGTGGDMLNIFDAMYVAQYVVGNRGAGFE
jgi:hypothetical protein